MNISVIELRNYLLKPGALEAFATHFNKYFIKPQALLGGHVLGEYGVAGHPDRFYWIRGFESMQSRSRFLPAFYGGTVWETYGPAANEMMLEWQDVYLLKPHPSPFVEANLFDDLNTPLRVDHYRARDNLAELQELLITNNTTASTAWISEMAKNDFPRLPVFQYPDLLTIISSTDSKTGELKEKEQSTLINSRASLILHPL